MSDTTGIQWTDATWNPLRGCSAVSPGCANCYAAAVAYRFSQKGQPYEGLAKQSSAGKPIWTGKVVDVPAHMNDPIKWHRKPRRIFVNSMSDLFHEAVSDDIILKIFDVMQRAPNHTYQCLTKRAGRMQAFMQKHFATAHLPQVWLGVSVENQACADERIPLLMATPGVSVRWLSCEPLLGHVDLSSFSQNPPDWVVVGGESGPRSRPMELGWALDIAAWTRANGKALFMKQLGEDLAKRREATTKKGDALDDFPGLLRRREFPTAQGF